MTAYRDQWFQLKLGHFCYRDVFMAFDEYTDRNPDLPAPADIINILEPPPQPLSAAVYVNYKKKAAMGDYLLSSERAYCAAFEQQEMDKIHGGSSKLREAQREISSFKQTLMIDDYNA